MDGSRPFARSPSTAIGPALRVARCAGPCSFGTLVFGLVLPAGASADTFCVTLAGPPSCTGTAEPTLEAALGAAGGTPVRDRIELGTASYPLGPFALLVSSSPGVDIVGTGAAATTLTTSSTDAVLYVFGDSTLSDLAIDVPAGANRGLDLSGTASATRVTVRGHLPTVGQSGVRLSGASAFRHGSIEMSEPQGGGSAAGVFFTGGARGATVEDSVVQGNSAVDGNGYGTVHRSRIEGAFGVGLISGILKVDSSLIHLPDFPGATARWAVSPGPSRDTGPLMANVILNDSTIVADPGSSPAAAFVCEAVVGQTAVVNARGVEVSGLLQRAFAGGPGNCTESYDYTNFDPGTSAGGTPGAHVTTVDPHFVDAAHGDYRLRFDSPLVDAGRPTAADPGDSATDLDGLPRAVDGNGTGGAVIDIGA